MKALLRFLLMKLFKIKIINKDYLKFNGPSLIMPNHLSFLDAVLLYLLLPDDILFVVNTEIAKRFAFFLKFSEHIPIDPLNPFSLKKIIQVVQSGKPVVLFPEGRITTTGGLMKVYDGIGLIALKTGATIYPVSLSGLEYSKFSRIKDKMKSSWFPKVQIYFDEPVSIAQLTSKLRDAHDTRELSNKILEIMQKSLFNANYQPESNLFKELLKAAKLHGSNKLIAEDTSQKVSYKQLLLASYGLGKKFAELCKKDQNIGVMLPNAIANLATLFGLFFAGKTPAIVNYTAGIQNNLDCMETANITTILTSKEFIEKAGLENLSIQLATKCKLIFLEDIKATINLKDKLEAFLNYFLGKQAAPSANQIIIFTSGSESKPKGVLLNHCNIIANIRQVQAVIDLTEKDKLLNVLPMFHSFGLTAGSMLPLLTGVEVFLYPNPLHYKTVPELCYDSNATILFGTSTFLAGYAKHAHPFDFQSIRYVFAGAEKLKDETKELWINKFGIRILEGYGTTETAPVLSLNTKLFYKEGSVGKFLPGIEWKLEKVEGIEDGGNLYVKGPNVMDGYLLHGKGFVPAEEWYNCGDIVSIDKDGFITIKSRLKRFAKVSGEMVSLNLVEELADKCFEPNSCASISVSDIKKGEIIILYTTLEDVTKQAFRNFLAANNQSPLLMPAEIMKIDKLPLLGSGKTDYVTLKNYWESSKHET